MSAKILVSNKAGGSQGEIIGIVGINHVFSKNESMQTWAESESSPWPSKFSVITVTDKTPAELKYLESALEVDGVPSELSMYYFEAPSEGSQEFTVLKSTGGIAADWLTVSAYLRTR